MLSKCLEGLEDQIIKVPLYMYTCICRSLSVLGLLVIHVHVTCKCIFHNVYIVYSHVIHVHVMYFIFTCTLHVDKDDDIDENSDGAQRPPGGKRKGRKVKFFKQNLVLFETRVGQ